MNVVMLATVCLLTLGCGFHSLWRGVFQGILARQIVVKGTAYTGSTAVKWGIVSIVYSLLFFGAAVLALFMLARAPGR